MINRANFGFGVSPGAGPPKRYALGGEAPAATPRVPIVAAGGEYVVSPEQVRQLGGGDFKKGHELLDKLVLHVRGRTIKQMQKLKGPVKS